MHIYIHQNICPRNKLFKYIRDVSTLVDCKNTLLIAQSCEGVNIYNTKEDTDKYKKYAHTNYTYTLIYTIFLYVSMYI